MTKPQRPEILVAAAPCPICGYDLRGHPDSTRCPECGRQVHWAAALSEATRWMDLRLLDLWSIGVLQSIGGLAGALTVLAIRQGHYVALMLGLLALLSMGCATAWFVVLLPVILIRTRRPFMRALGARQLGRLRRWSLLDTFLVLLAPLLGLILAKA